MFYGVGKAIPRQRDDPRCACNIKLVMPAPYSVSKPDRLKRSVIPVPDSKDIFRKRVSDVAVPCVLQAVRVHAPHTPDHRHVNVERYDRHITSACKICLRCSQQRCIKFFLGITDDYVVIIIGSCILCHPDVFIADFFRVNLCKAVDIGRIHPRRITGHQMSVVRYRHDPRDQARCVDNICDTLDVPAVSCLYAIVAAYTVIDDYPVIVVEDLSAPSLQECRAFIPRDGRQEVSPDKVSSVHRCYVGNTGIRAAGRHDIKRLLASLPRGPHVHQETVVCAIIKDGIGNNAHPVFCLCYFCNPV